MPKKSPESLTESQIERLFEVVIGFNDSKERRFEADGKSFVKRGDFSESDWKSLISMGAVRLVENVEVREDEVVVFEKIGE